MSDAAESSPRLPTLAIATIGHHRHGKTTLLAAMTRVLARREGAVAAGRSVEELDRRGGSPPLELSGGTLHVRPTGDVGAETLTVRGTSLRWATSRRAFAHFDAPGRRPWVTNVARALGAADAALLVVSAPESVQPQTIEHLQLARALGIRQLVVFVGKCDLVADIEWLDLVERDIRDLLDRCGFDGDGTRILRGAARPAYAGPSPWDAGVLDLIEALETELTVPERPVTGAPLFVCDRVFGRRPGNRVLVEGRLQRGEVAIGDTLWALAGRDGRAQRLRTVEVETYHRKLARASAGDQIGLLLYGVDRDVVPSEMRTGQPLVREEAPLIRELVARVELFARADAGRPHALRDGTVASLVFGAMRAIGALRGEGAAIEPGGAGTVRVTLQTPQYVEPGLRFALRDGSQGAWRKGQPAVWAGIVGAGTIVAVGEPVGSP